MEKEELISSYDELSIGDKRKELGREIAEITLITQKLISDLNPGYQLKSMDDFTNLFEENTPEDNYLTGLYQDVIELEETIGTYYNMITDVYYEDSMDSENISGDNLYQPNGENDLYPNATGYTKTSILVLITAIMGIALIMLGVFFLV